MKIKYLIIIALLICAGCGSKEKTTEEVEYRHITSYYKKIDDETVKLMFILENASDEDGVIKYIGYGANDVNDKSLGYDGENVNIEFKKHQQVLITTTLKITDAFDKIDYIFLTPFYEPKKFIKEAKFTGDNSDKYEIAKFTEELSSIISDETTLYNIKLKPDTNISAEKLELIIYDEENYPLCVAYSDVNKQIVANESNEYKFECEDVIEKTSNIQIYYK